MDCRVIGVINRHVHAFDYSGTRCRTGKISRRNHPRRRLVGDGCRNGSPSGLRDRAPDPQARRSRSGLYAARRTRPLRPLAIAVASRSSRSCLLPGRLVPLLQSAPARLSTRSAGVSAICGANRSHLAAVAGQFTEHTGKDELTFAVLSDVGNKVARRFGIVFQIGEKLQKLYRKFGHPLDLFNGSDGAEHLPVPGTFLVDGKGVIRLAHIDVDYTRRLDPDDVITTLRELTAWTKLGS